MVNSASCSGRKEKGRPSRRRICHIGKFLLFPVTGKGLCRFLFSIWNSPEIMPLYPKVQSVKFFQRIMNPKSTHKFDQKAFGTNFPCISGVFTYGRGGFPVYMARCVPEENGRGFYRNRETPVPGSAVMGGYPERTITTAWTEGGSTGVKTSVFCKISLPEKLPDVSL